MKFFRSMLYSTVHDAITLLENEEKERGYTGPSALLSQYKALLNYIDNKANYAIYIGNEFD